MDLRKQNRSPSSGSLRDEEGFAYVFFISFLPLLLTGIFFILFFQFLTQNWAQSLYICRSHLLSTQNKVGKSLSQLMHLNSNALQLRLALQEAERELATAIATENYPLQARAILKIRQIHLQQNELDRQQRSLIEKSNFEMQQGVQSVEKELSRQSQVLQSRLPADFQFRILSIHSEFQKLAVRPDVPGPAHVYVLEEPFKERQALHVSWISDFQTRTEKSQWIVNHHRKEASCTASLSARPSLKFSEILTEDKSSLKPWFSL